MCIERIFMGPNDKRTPHAAPFTYGTKRRKVDAIYRLYLSLIEPSATIAPDTCDHVMLGVCKPSVHIWATKFARRSRIYARKKKKEKQIQVNRR